jgi:thiamine-phosphate pyrophosphorylase
MSRIYLITPPAIDLPAFAASLPAVLDAGDIACFQLRLKNASDDDLKRAVQTLMPIVVQHDIAFVLNDRVDLAKQLGCDGVHLGQNDAPLIEARKILGPHKIIGVSCYNSKHRAMFAASEGADYIAFGVAFPESSATKPQGPQAPLALYEDWVTTTTTPVVAIGGITAANCAALVRVKVDFLAIIGAVWNHAGGPVAGMQALNAAIEGAKGLSG